MSLLGISTHEHPCALQRALCRTRTRRQPPNVGGPQPCPPRAPIAGFPPPLGGGCIPPVPPCPSPAGFPSRLRDGCIPPRQRFHAAITSQDVPDPPASATAAPCTGFCPAREGGASRRKSAVPNRAPRALPSRVSRRPWAAAASQPCLPRPRGSEPQCPCAPSARIKTATAGSTRVLCGFCAANEGGASRRKSAVPNRAPRALPSRVSRRPWAAAASHLCPPAPLLRVSHRACAMAASHHVSDSTPPSHRKMSPIHRRQLPPRPAPGSVPHAKAAPAAESQRSPTVPPARSHRGFPAALGRRLHPNRVCLGRAEASPHDPAHHQHGSKPPQRVPSGFCPAREGGASRRMWAVPSRSPSQGVPRCISLPLHSIDWRHLLPSPRWLQRPTTSCQQPAQTSLIPAKDSEVPHGLFLQLFNR
jgi:hypothetical protein